MLQSSMFKFTLIGKLVSIVSWLRVISWVLTSRGIDTHGPEEVKKALIFYHFTKKREIIELEHFWRFLDDVLSNIWPKEICLDLVRVGPRGDAGYTIAFLEKYDLILSGGAGKNIDFEIYFADNGSQVHVFDPFVRNLPLKHEKIKHHRILLQGRDSSNNSHQKTLSHAESFVNLDSSQINLLKLDIEGSELDLLGLQDLSLSHYDQIVIEVHDTFKIIDLDYRQRFNRMLSNLLKNHHVIYFSTNNNGLTLTYGTYFLPEVFEITLLHHKYFPATDVKKVKFTDAMQTDNNNPQRIAALNIFSIPPLKL